MASLWHPCKFQRVSRLGSVTARHSSSGRQPNFAALNRRLHLNSTGRPSRALAHISSWLCYTSNFSVIHAQRRGSDVCCIFVVFFYMYVTFANSAFYFLCSGVISFSPHRSRPTIYVDAAYFYRRSSMVCLCVGLSVFLSVCHDREPCKNG